MALLWLFNPSYQVREYNEVSAIGLRIRMYIYFFLCGPTVTSFPFTSMAKALQLKIASLYIKTRKEMEQSDIFISIFGWSSVPFWV